MDALIVGAGAMGRWFAESIDATVAFADADEAAAREAASRIGGRPVALDADEKFDVVCFAVPISAVETSVETHAEKATTAVIDVSGVMAAPLASMAEHAPERERLSLHPLFGPDNAPGNVAVVVEEPGPVTDEIRRQLSGQGNALFETTPERHDDAMASVQASAHAAVLAFALAAEPVPEEFYTPIFEELAGLVEQVTDGTPRVYAEIQSTFEGATDVAAAANRIAAADPEAFERLYREAGETW